MPQMQGQDGPRVSLELLDDAVGVALDERGWSRRRLASHLRLSPSTLTRISQGMRPDADALAVLLAWLRLPAEQLLALDDPARSDPTAEPAGRRRPVPRERPTRPSARDRRGASATMGS